MDTSHNVRGRYVRRQRLCDVDLQGCSTSPVDWLKWCRDLAVLNPEAFTRLVETVSKEDRAVTDQILRLWGIRR